jgi:hypothetical protein
LVKLIFEKAFSYFLKLEAYLFTFSARKSDRKGDGDEF